MKPETPLTEADVARVFDALAEEHAKKLGSTEGHRTFQRIERAMNARMMSRIGHGRLTGPRLAALTLAPAAAAAAVTLALTSWLTPGPLAFEVEGAVEQAGLIQTGAKPAVLRFSDDSRVEAAAHTSLSMSLVGEHGALARLQKGQLSIKVEHADETDWRFLAGPYEVRVVGTEFDLSWQDESSQLSVVMHEGRVRVVGPDQTETILSAGESRVFREPARAVEAAKSANEPASQAVAQVEPSKKPDAPAAPEVQKPATPSVATHVAAPTPSVASKLSWAKLVAKGRFADVVEQAERAGVDAALAARGSQDLQALAQAAHYTGHNALALKTWSRVRQRFGGEQAGRQAAFFMGRIYDQQGNGQIALRWLNTYLAEAGSDVYASEALGRKLTLVQRLQSKAQAEQVAREYLRRFPQGAYARAAQTLLDQ